MLKNALRLINLNVLQQLNRKIAPFSTENGAAAIKERQANPFTAAKLDVTETSATTRDEMLVSEERTKALKMLKFELSVAYEEGSRVPPPESVTDEEWNTILGLKTRSGRAKYYLYLFKTYHSIQNEKRKKLEHAKNIEAYKEAKRKAVAENEHISYGLGGVTFFLKIYDRTIDRFNNHRLLNAMQFAPKLVFDCAFDDKMTQAETTNLGKQLMLCFADNRFNDQPFDLHFCTVNPKARSMQALYRHIPKMYDTDFPMNVHADCPTKMFPKERLVYLTQHSRKELTTYDPDDIYIINALVDKRHNERASLAKAKALGLRMACLPFHRYLQWTNGSNQLALNIRLRIMLDLKNTGNWDLALKNVPRRLVADQRHVRLSKEGLRYISDMFKKNEALLKTEVPPSQKKNPFEHK